MIKSGVWFKSKFNSSSSISEITIVSNKCKEAKEKAKEAYLKTQGNKFERHYFPQDDAFTLGVINIIGEYAASNWVGDGEKWNIERNIKRNIISRIFAKIFDIYKKHLNSSIND